MVRHTLTHARPQVLAWRMVRDYVEDCTSPPPGRRGGSRRSDFAPARELAAFRSRLNAAWPLVEVLGVDASGLPDTPVVGAPMTVRAVVALAGLDPADVAVEVVLGPGRRVRRAQRDRDGADEARRAGGRHEPDGMERSRRRCSCRTRA